MQTSTFFTVSPHVGTPFWCGVVARCIATPQTLANTLPAFTVPIFSRICVFGSVLMVLRAMRLSSMLSRWCLPAKNVLAIRDWLKVGRIYAHPISAKVVQYQSRWYLPLLQLIGKAMSQKLHSLSRVKIAIPFWVNISLPGPTSKQALRAVNLRPKSAYANQANLHSLIIANIGGDYNSRT